MRVIKHQDNIMVQRRKWGCEYLEIIFQDHDAESPWPVAVHRYCVPGRCDSYMFDWTPGRAGYADRLRFSTETNDSLPQAIADVQKDFDKPQVVKMVVEACSKVELFRYSRTFVEHLLAAIAPKSKSLRAARKALDKTLAERKRLYEAKKAREAAELAEKIKRLNLKHETKTPKPVHRT